MKIAVSIGNYKLLNTLKNIAKEQDIQIELFNHAYHLKKSLENDEIDAYIVTNRSKNIKEIVDFIRKEHAHIPIIGIIMHPHKIHINNVDVKIPYHKDYSDEFLSEILLYNCIFLKKNFNKLRLIYTKDNQIIKLGENLTYDVDKRLIKRGEEKIATLALKQSGIFEILAINFGIVVEKNILLEKLWFKSNYFVGRSFDVFIRHIRITIEKFDLNLSLITVKVNKGYGYVLTSKDNPEYKKYKKL